jgi:hypothetical protein
MYTPWEQLIEKVQNGINPHIWWGVDTPLKREV